jgi:hypothetical protein
MPYTGPSDENILIWEKNQLRGNRNKLLDESDWTQLADVPLTDPEKAAWATYRQELRDLPATITDLNDSNGIDVVWPTEPA